MFLIVFHKINTIIRSLNTKKRNKKSTIIIQFKFETISATIGGREYKISREDLVKSFKETDRRLLAEIPPSMRRRVVDLLEKGDFERA